MPVSKYKTLVTSSDFNTWPENLSKALFIGPWCIRSNIPPGQSQLVPYHWKNREKFNSDYFYLKDLNTRLLQNLAEFLNQYHKLDYSVDYWRCIVGPWLIEYFSAIFDRWEVVGSSIKFKNINEISTIDYCLNKNTPNDFSEARKLFQMDAWNSAIFHEIFQIRNLEKIKVKKIDYFQDSTIKEEKSKLTKTILHQIYRLSFIVYEKLFLKKNILFTRTYFSIYAILKISIKIRGFLGSFNEFLYPPRKFKFPKERNLAEKFTQFIPKNDFEKYIHKTILRDIPFQFIENFNYLRQTAKEIKKDYKIIFTSNLHTSNELFQVWFAERVEKRKSILVISNHGGSIPTFNDLFQHEFLLPAIKVNWFKSEMFGSIQMPANKICGIEYKVIFYKYIKRKKRKLLNLFMHQAPLYSIRHMTSPILGPLILEEYDEKLKFLQGLNKDIFKNVNVRLSGGNDEWRLCEKFHKTFGRNICDRRGSAIEAILTSKIVVCDTSTIFAESMHLNIPTIALIDINYWDFEEGFEDLITHLLKVKILFFCPIEASIHINKIWQDIDHWWNSHKIQSARKIFLELLADSKDYDKRWANFFTKILDKEI